MPPLSPSVLLRPSARRSRRLLLFPLLFLLFAAGFSACSDDAPQEADTPTSPHQFRIEIASADMFPTNRAGTAVDVEANELIKQWMVIMVKEGKIEKIFRGQPGSEQDKVNVATFTGAAGPRDFHCFANVSENEVVKMYRSAGYAGTTFTEGASVPGSEALKRIGFPVSHTGMIPGKTSADFSIPMSNMEEQVYVDANTTVRLYVYRILSKVRFQLMNNSGTTLRLKGIEMGDITADNADGAPSQVCFFPPRNEQGAIATIFPKDENGNDIHQSHSRFSFFSSSAGEELAAGATLTKEYYISPSVSQHPTQHFPLWVEIDGVAGMQTERFALTSLSSIRRNSIVTLPIILTGYDMTLQAFHYAPIGGYPAVKVERKDDGEFYCIFSGSGDFALRPSVYAYADRLSPSKWIDINQTSIVTDKTLTVDDPQHIFDVLPRFNGGAEIVGTLGNTTGTATVKLSLQIKVSEALTQTFTRIFYVIHK